MEAKAMRLSQTTSLEGRDLPFIILIQMRS